MANVAVINYLFTVDGEPISKVGNMMFLKIRIEYAGGVGGIEAGDTIQVEIDNDTNQYFKIVGFGHDVIDIYGDDPIGKVGTRQYRYDAAGNYYIEVVFDDGYKNYYGDPQPDNITGWIEVSAYVEYKGEVTGDDKQGSIESYVNGIHLSTNVIVPPGGGVGPGPEYDYPGAIVSKSWRYGAYSGNLYDLPEVSDNDYSKFEVMRYYVNVAFQNLTWRDLRASGGEKFYTTEESLAYSTDNPTGDNYQSELEPYIKAYADEFYMGEIDNPYLYTNAVIDDYLSVGMHYGTLTSAHEYVKDSIRIIRIVGREDYSSWWGRYAFRSLADSNFLVDEPSEPIDRYLTGAIWNGKRGLTIQEFLDQLHNEGQLLDCPTVDDIFTIDYVRNSESPFAPSSTDDPLIAHFKLQLGNLFFGEVNQTVDLIGQGNNVALANIPASNLPYGYMIYYDTEAVEAILHNGAYHYYNALEFSHEEDAHNETATDLFIRMEDASGGAGVHKEIRLKKIDPDGEPIPGVVFRLTQINVTPLKIREATTTINGTASFTLGVGDYLLEEISADGNWQLLPPMAFSVVSSDTLIDLSVVLSPSYEAIDDITFANGLNTIVNHSGKPSKTSIVLEASKVVIGKDVEQGMFSFGVYENDVLVATGTNDENGLVVFDEIEYDEVGVYEYVIKEIV